MPHQRRRTSCDWMQAQGLAAPRVGWHIGGKRRALYYSTVKTPRARTDRFRGMEAPDRLWRRLILVKCGVVGPDVLAREDSRLGSDYQGQHASSCTGHVAFNCAVLVGWHWRWCLVHTKDATAGAAHSCANRGIAETGCLHPRNTHP
jgi:hypothetical protein